MWLLMGTEQDVQWMESSRSKWTIFIITMVKWLVLSNKCLCEMVAEYGCKKF